MYDFTSFRSVHVGLEATEKIECVLFVSYVVSQTSWRSAYDVRVFLKTRLWRLVILLHEIETLHIWNLNNAVIQFVSWYIQAIQSDCSIHGEFISLASTPLHTAK